MAMIIDFHTHIFPPGIKDNLDRYIRADSCFAELYSDNKARLTTADELIESMDREEIDISVVLNIGWTTNKLCVETNDYIMESIARFPGRLIGFCTVQPSNHNAAISEIERCISGGIRGVGEIRPDIQQIDLNDSGTMDDFIEISINNNLVFLIHSSEPAGHEYKGKGKVTPDIMYPFIMKYPDLKIVCAHWGGGLPFYYLMPEVKRDFKNVYFDTAASPFLYSPEIYSQVIKLTGAEKILFGSDFPLLKPGRLIREINTVKLPDEEKRLIMGDNARQLLGIY
jgi:uncharacterized protein